MEVRQRVATRPDEVGACSPVHLFGMKTKACPLHLLCKKKQLPLDILDIFVKVYPQATRIPDSYHQRLPIHVACRSGASPDVIKKLLDEFAEGLFRADYEGNLPIHLACSFGSMEAISLLLRPNSGHLDSTNKKHQTPLHMVCSRDDVSLSVVQGILDVSTSACKVTDWQGQLPLHKAVMWKLDSVIVTALVDSFPEGIRAVDTHKLTPYEIHKKRVGGRSDLTTHLLRSYHRRNGTIRERVGDALRFRVEASEQFMRIHRQRSLRRANLSCH